MLIPRITEPLTVDDLEELAAYLSAKLARRLPAGVSANEAQMATLVTGYMRDWLEAREGEIAGAPDPDDGPDCMYDPHDFEDHYLTRSR